MGVHPSTPHDGSDHKKQRTWERHRWSYQHDEALFDMVIKHEAWSKKFGGIMKSWKSVADELMESSEFFRPWGNLKTDMLRRRFEKIYYQHLTDLKKKGVALDALDGADMSDLEKKCLQIKGMQESVGTDVDMHMKNRSQPHTSPGGLSHYGTPNSGMKQKSAKQREEELDQIKDTVTKFLDKSLGATGQMGNEYLTGSVEMIANLADSIESLQEKDVGMDDTVKRLVTEQLSVTKHLIKQNDLLLGLLAKVISKSLL
ncbi:hypothetical protein HOP50_20g85760 [Chloropicon primus]|nr:hypothetical protein A3770_20p85430 [Chloropicon primus]UPR05226.1 hypothetical protein HOP50_20g85760 [Chloropicon primus]|eukprot:QDZ26025.1 hypothetical protein A3770_20p85430 [Chloropicon primus]